jgi:predicted ATPase with chaperone activity
METDPKFRDEQDEQGPAEFNTPPAPEGSSEVPSFFARSNTPESPLGGAGDEPSDSMSQFISRTMASVAEAEGPAVEEGLIPRAPRTFADVGLSRAFLTDLTLKIMHYSGTPSMSQISKRLGLSGEIVGQILQTLSEERLVDIMSQSDLFTGNYRYRLSEKGQGRVSEALERTRYAGPAPVTADQYTKVMAKLLQEKHEVSRHEITEALKDLVLTSDVSDAVARALFSGKTTLFYGPSGNGKTVILERFAQSLDGYSVMPYAIYAYGQVIRVFDPSIHHAVDQPLEDEGSMKDESNLDRRWVKVRRPAIILGAEMDRDALDLGYDPQAKFYQAPPHIKAQNGVLVVDDFGRQRVTTTDLLTRWLIPLERGWDSLSLVTGEKLTVPFRLQLLFGTNARVRDVADDALLRRILYKVRIPNPEEGNFGEIFRRECRNREVPAEDGAIEYAVQRLYEQPGMRPRASYARDLVNILIESAAFDGSSPVLSKDSFDKVFQLFVTGESDQDEGLDEDF